MPKQIVLRTPPSTVERRQPLLIPRRQRSSYSSSSSSLSSSSSSSGGGSSKRVAEVVGGTTAECAAICCCCPCGLVNLLVLVVYKVPAGLCRKALRRKRPRKMVKQGLLQPKKCGCQHDLELIQVHPLSDFLSPVNEAETDKDVVELEKEMWDRFYGAGFWRSPSQRTVISL